MFRVKRLSSARLLTFAILILSLAGPLLAQAPDPNLGELAEQLMYGHSRGPRKKLKNRAKEPYLVMDFETAPSKHDRLGVELANDFAQALHVNCPEIATLDRSQLGAMLEKEHLGPQVLQVEEVALWFAKLVGARSVIFGKISPHEKGFDLTTRLVDTYGKELSRATKSIAWSEERRALLEFPLLQPSTTPTSQTPRGAIKPGGAGAPEPKCKYCPQPPYSDEARAAHVEGTVLLDLEVSPEGNVRVMSVRHPLPDWLTAEAVDTARKWKFIPTKGPDGKPVTLDVDVEISFRLLY